MTARGQWGSGGTVVTAARVAAAAALVWLVVLATGASAAWAAFGDEFGLVPLNDHPDAIDAVPVYPDSDTTDGDGSVPAVEQKAFWAGVCERARMPSPGTPLAGTGEGAAPAQVFAPNANSSPVPPFHDPVPAPAVPAHCIDWGAPFAFRMGLPSWVVPPAWRLPAAVQAGGHPDATSTFALRRNDEGENNQAAPDGHVDNVIVHVPPGFVGNPQAVAECSQEQFAVEPPRCPPQSQVGLLTLHMEGATFSQNLGALGWEAVYPVWNLEPRQGRIAELGIAYASGERATSVRLSARVRTSSDFGVTAFIGQIPATLTLSSQSITLWGVPWAAENDVWRVQEEHAPRAVPCAVQPETGDRNYIPPGGLSPGCQARYEPGWGSIRPFLIAETDCNPAPATWLWMDSYQNPGSFGVGGEPDPADEDWERASVVSPAVEGCEQLDFDPRLELEATSDAADAPSGLTAQVELAQNEDPPAAVAQDPGDADDPDAGAPGHWRSQAGLATAHLKDTVVRLPEGFSVNPSGATGLVGCSDAQIGVRGAAPSGRLLFNDGDPFNADGGADGAECPQASIIGTVRVETPLLDEDLAGELVLGTPKSTAPASGQMFRLFIVVRNSARGLVAKVFGSSTADPATGGLTARFAENPEVPFERLTVNVKGGPRGMLATPERCGNHGWSSSLTPWSSVGAPFPVADAARAGSLPVDARCAFGFAPALDARMDGRRAREGGTLFFVLSRADGEQRLSGVSARMPGGLLASVRGVPLCTSAQASANACPAGSRIGFVDGSAGAGDPFVLERKGTVYLTESYKGAPYGLAVVVPVEAGPFRGPLALSPIVVRAALRVDPRTARVTAVSDPLPQIHHGIPLRLRRVNVVVDRPGFMLNPSDCSPKEIGADVTSPGGAAASPTVPFHAAGCPQLRFKPKLALRLTGRRQTTTGRHPGVRALVRQSGVREAGIEDARVALPRSLALDPANAQALCEFEDGTRPDLEDHCPRGAIVGRARAVSPLLNRPLSGPVFFVKNIRTDPETGNPIRTLPMIVVALRGEIAINLYGESSVDRRQRLVSTFAEIPDAPISRFAMRLAGGRGGILAVTRTRRSTIDICRGRQIARSRMLAHNDRRRTRRIRIATPCPKRGRACKAKPRRRTKACKRRASKRRAAKRRAGTADLLASR